VLNVGRHSLFRFRLRCGTTGALAVQSLPPIRVDHVRLVYHARGRSDHRRVSLRPSRRDERVGRD
jgi:hypothetical protein